MVTPDAEQFFRLIEHHAVRMALCVFPLIGIIKLILLELQSAVDLYEQLRTTIKGKENRRAAGSD